MTSNQEKLEGFLKNFVSNYYDHVNIEELTECLQSLSTEDRAYTMKNTLNVFGTTIHWLGYKCDSEAIKCLLDSLPPNQRSELLMLQNNYGNTAIHISAGLGHTEFLTCLQDDIPSDPNVPQGTRCSTCDDDTDTLRSTMAQLTLEQRIQLFSISNIKGETALDLALARLNRPEVIEYVTKWQAVAERNLYDQPFNRERQGDSTEVKELKRQLKGLRGSVNDKLLLQSKQYKALNESHQELKSRVRQLVAEKDNLKGQVEQVTGQVEKLNAANDLAAREKGVLTGQVEKLEAANESLKSECGNLGLRCTAQETEMEKLRLTVEKLSALVESDKNSAASMPNHDTHSLQVLSEQLVQGAEKQTETNTDLDGRVSNNSARIKELEGVKVPTAATGDAVEVSAANSVLAAAVDKVQNTQEFLLVQNAESQHKITELANAVENAATVPDVVEISEANGRTLESHTLAIEDLKGSVGNLFAKSEQLQKSNAEVKETVEYHEKILLQLKGPPVLATS